MDDETHNRELDIFTRCAIKYEGLFGTTESPKGSNKFASCFAAGENYVICKVKRGVKYLGDILSRGVNMHDTHTSRFSASMGHRTFTAMMKSIFKLKLGGNSMDDILVRVKCREEFWR